MPKKDFFIYIHAIYKYKYSYKIYVTIAKS